MNLAAQTEAVPYASNTTAENRTREYRNLVNNVINKNLSLDLNDSTEEYWQGAFYALELIQYRSAWVDGRIRLAFDSIEKRSIGFQRSALEMIYALSIKDFAKSVNRLLTQTENSKIFAMCAEYLLLYNDSFTAVTEINRLLNFKMMLLREEKDQAILIGLNNHPKEQLLKKYNFPFPVELFDADYLKGNVIVYSVQRKNRNYPGIVIVRDTGGNFIKNNIGKIFSVPQLARSITNLPGYLTNGNTPQGIFRMDGFAVSKSSFIGPTENIQLTMPAETTIRHFFKDSSAADSNWTKELYKKLLPGSLKNSEPLYQSFYAGMAGRTEIIAHGTTVNPDYYKNQPYFPLTPTLGCLTTKEIWNTVDGKRIESDQQKLVNAIKAAGGADGYCIVIEIDDGQKPVSIDEILSYLNKK